MAFPSKLKQTMMFNDGEAFIGETVSITPPKLVRKFEDYRAGGMSRAVKVDMGGEALEMEATYGGPMRQILRQHGMLNISGVQQRFVGSFQNDDTGAVDVVEIVTRGRHEEIDMGEWKPGEDTEFKVKSQLSYFKLTWNDVVEVEIDVLGMIEVVGGVDLMAAHRGALGL
ncbi:MULTISPECIES: phage major tail tube protein [unclassified Sphingomonas]|jgi:P2 family phage contractile tail tube protein|uniref:phage major tail tube protein n=1 Tax=unclassified Sphingomonas TaxID=196159 RepID=UPI0004DB703B|nr:MULTISPECIES: phage major tail tube protein [unclassified Sphingomonas]KQN14291.1 phage tail protein [Sphingomonas sp. Leaf30]